MREYGHQEVKKRFKILLKEKKNIILDTTNVNLRRIFYTQIARLVGHQVKALVFDTSDFKKNESNIFLRRSLGDHDLVNSSEEKSDQKRNEIISYLFKNLKAFYPKQGKSTGDPIDIESIDSNTLETRENSPKLHRKSLDQSEKKFSTNSYQLIILTRFLLQRL